MFAKGWRKKDFLERRGQISYQKAWAAAMMTSLDAFFAGIGFGFLGTEILAVGLILELVTLIFALAGTFVGYRLGYEQRTKAYAIGGIILIIAGIDAVSYTHLCDDRTGLSFSYFQGCPAGADWVWLCHDFL